MPGTAQAVGATHALTDRDPIGLQRKKIGLSQGTRRYPASGPSFRAVPRGSESHD